MLPCSSFLCLQSISLAGQNIWNLLCATAHLSSLNIIKTLWLTRTFIRSIPPNICLTLACQWCPERGTTRHHPASLTRGGSGASHHRRCEFSSRNEQQHEFPQERLRFYFGALCRKKKPIKTNLATTVTRAQLYYGKLVCYQIHVGWRTVWQMVLSRLYFELPWKLLKTLIFSSCLECLNIEPENVSVVHFLFGEQ